MNAFILAAPNSGSGKTTIALALMKALGDRVVPFKIGPDYIDPMFHKVCLNKASYNLDLVMCGEEGIKNTFYSNLKSNSIAIAEGVMGLFDGTTGKESGYGSSAHISQVLNIPVILLLDSRGLSTSGAAIVKGFKDFKILKKKTQITGVILNRVKSESTYKLLKSEIEKNTGVPVLGYFPEDKSIVLNSRHLGLIPPEEVDSISKIIEKAGRAAKEHINLKKLLELTQYKFLGMQNSEPESLKDFSGIHIAYAFDEAFNFYYQENLDLLKSLGIKLTPFSPLKDTSLPKDIDALYLGGGFPEVFFSLLEKNTDLKNEIKSKLEDGLYCYAECGGLIYLSKTINYQGKTYSGVGFFDNEITMSNRLQNFGYCELTIGEKSVIAHEFHHTEETRREDLKCAYIISQRGKKREGGMVKKNTIAGYPHIHFNAKENGKELLFSFLEKIKKNKLEN